ncbi:MAG: reductive dehalogenase [Chloroflexi bacterium]|nr:MAG: reductive dehalogenase [Chloroflexota bacterium]MBL1194877.1 reductive dehalogenase [Chloroflexota bacterium]NOH12168.1 reductive dehalogenase [Chloroflexota bacterium]
MSESKISRRDFLKIAGLAGVAMPVAKVIGQVDGDNVLYSPEEYGGFLVRQRPADNPPYQVDDSIYKRFDQKNEVFSRVQWDPVIQESEAPYASKIGENIMGNVKGFTRLDYAFYTAAWTVATTIGSTAGAVGGSNGGLYSWNPLGGFAGRIYGQEMPPWNGGDWSPEDVSGIVKTAAKFYGASLSGIAEVDERWFYDKRYTKGGTDTMGPGISAPIRYEEADAPQELEDGTLIIPKKMKYVISLAFEMDYDGMQTYLSGPGSAATGNGYSRMTFTAACVAEFIRALGYQAIPSGNCTAMSVAVAVDAGLGELGRHGLLMTPKYGPRVRLAKVFTDMPLVPDQPISFGATEFCEVCGKCADTCPGNAIPHGERTYEATYDAPNHISSNPGVLKWYVDTPACHLVWAVNGMDCSKCIQTCPFNKPDSWLHEATRVLIGAKNGTIDQFLLTLDDASGFGEQQDPDDFWRNKEVFVHTKEA